MGINDWAEQERPRERLVREGAAALSNPELLALLLRVGVRGKSAVELGRDVLQHFGSLHGLFGASLTDFSEVNGLGLAKYAQLQAVMELARRAIGEQMQAGQALSSPETVKRYLRMKLGGQRHESFVVLFVDVKNRLIADKELFRGTLTQIKSPQLRNYFPAVSCRISAGFLKRIFQTNRLYNGSRPVRPGARQVQWAARRKACAWHERAVACLPRRHAGAAGLTPKRAASSPARHPELHR